MSKIRAAVIGVGQTHHRAKREDLSMAGLCREAMDRALADAGMTLDEVDAIVVGKAPDLFEGVMMPELYLAEALGAAGTSAPTRSHPPHHYYDICAPR